MAVPPLEKNYLIHVYETGPDGKLNLYSLFDFFQDIASDHALNLGYGREDLLKLNHFWVLSRISAEINEMPAWGDRIVIRTWPRGTDKVFALRDFEVFFPDGRPVASASSSWLIIDNDTRKIQRPDEKLMSLNFEPGIKSALTKNAGKLDPLPENTPVASRLNVKASDLDVNQHTNNVKYLKWVTDSYDLDFLLNNVPYSAEINYLAESRFNDKIAVRTCSENGRADVISSSIVREPENTELCRIRICWKKNHGNE